VLQIISAQQHAPIHVILPRLKLNRTGDSTHSWSTKHVRYEAQKVTDSLQRYDAATTSNQKQHGAHLHDYVHPQADLKGPNLCLLEDDSLTRIASPGASFVPKRTSTLGSLNEATMSTRLHTAWQVNAAHWCAATPINLLHKLTK